MSAPESTTSLNPGQCAALDLRRDMIVSAGAGAGKTRVLGLRVLALLELGYARIDEIVAITFTEKAAAEMRERVQSLLLARIQELELVHDKLCLPRLKLAQSEFSRNRISTVHSFCYRLLREYAWEAGLEPNAAILDERRQASARDAAIRNVLLRGNLDEDAALAAALTRLGAAMPLRDLRDAVEALLRERNVGGPALQLAAQRWAEPEAEIARRVHEHAELLEAALAPVHEAISQLNFKAAKAAPGDKLSELMLELKQADVEALTSLLLTANHSPRSFGSRGAASKWKHDPEALEQGRAAVQEIANAFAEAVSRVPLQVDEAFERRAGAVLRDLWEVFQRVAREYAEACAGGLDFLDLELRTLALLKDSAETRDELARRMRFLLVDEFQDTNPTQAELFALLRQADETPGRFFAVGDAKQSVYGFRGSDVSIFNRALTEIPKRNKASGAGKLPLDPPWGLVCDDTKEQRGGVVRLAHNYRTVAPVLELGNRVFQKVFTVPDPQPHDAQPQDMIVGSDAVPILKPVELHFLPKPKASKPDEDAARVRRDDEAEFIAQRVKALRDGGVPLRDIAILVRRGTRNWEYRGAFARHDLPLLVLGEAGLFSTQEGQDCLNLLRALANPADDIAMLGLLRSPLAGLSDRYLTELALRHDRGSPILARLQADATSAPPEAATFLARFAALRERAGRDAPALLLTEALAQCGYALAVGCGFDAEQRLGNVERVVDVVRETQQEFPALALLVRELLNRLDAGDRESQGTPESSADGVRLLTVHKAKGLEFPVVIVPDLAASPGGGGGGVVRCWPVAPGQPLGLWLRSTDEDSLGDSQCDLYGGLAAKDHAARAEAEERRILYVAWTRAQSRLILVGTAGAEIKGGGWAGLLSQALGISEWGDASAEPALDLQWRGPVERTDPKSHAPSILRARAALESGSLDLPEAIDASLCVEPVAAPAAWVKPDAVEFGTLVHAAMELHMRAAGAEAGMLEAGGSELAAHVQRARQALATRPVALRERPEFSLLTPQGARRFDLLRELEGDTYEIIDYKTDRVQGDLQAHAEAEHGQQLRAYARSLVEMLSARGKPPRLVRTFVCFTGPDALNPAERLVEISPD